VSRAFSFNKTPRRIKRAVSHVFSPFVKDNPREFTPGNLRGKRLASSIDLTVSKFYVDKTQTSRDAIGARISECTNHHYSVCGVNLQIHIFI
jgi:hypothetical protein